MKRTSIVTAAALATASFGLMTPSGATQAAQGETVAAALSSPAAASTTAATPSAPTASSPISPALAQKKGSHVDTQFGFEFKLPKRYDKKALSSTEPWVRAHYESEKAYSFYDKERGQTFIDKPTVKVIVFPKGRLKISEDEQKKKKKTLDTKKTARMFVPFDDYEGYLDRTFGGGGFFKTDEEEDEIDGITVIKQTFVVEKLARSGPKTMEAWIYQTPDMDYAVEVVGLTKHWKPITKSVKNPRRSFEIIPREGDDSGQAAESGTAAPKSKRKTKRKKMGDDVLVMDDGRIITDLNAEQLEGKVTVHLESGDIDIKDNYVDMLIEPDAGLSFKPQTELEQERFDQGYVPYNGRWLRKSNAERLVKKEIAQRLKDAKSDLEHREWRNAYEEETRNFNWKFTTGRGVTQRYIEAADQYFQIFAKEWRIKRDKGKEKMYINFYVEVDQYQRVAGAPPGALAYFYILGNYDLNAYYDRLDPDFTESVLFHELGHYLHKLIDEDFDYPHWPGESVCEYYSAAKLDEDGDLTVGLIQNGRLGSILRDIEGGRKIDLREMITTRGGEDYSWGWALVHMLMSDDKDKERFKKFFHGLASDRSVKRVTGGRTGRTVPPDEVLRYFMECMELKDDEALDAMQDRWYRYMTEELKFTGEGAIFLEAKSARSLGEFDTARELYKKGFETEMDVAKANQHYDYFLLLSDRRGNEAKKHLEHAVEKAPLTAVFRYELGELLESKKKKTDKEEGARQKAIALELDPDVEDKVFRLIFVR